MSGIGSVGGASAAQYLRKLSGSSSCSESDADAPTPDDLNQDIEEAGGTVDYTDLRSQIEAAIKSALSGTTSASDPSTFLSKVKDAIGQTLQANGIDPAKLKGALEAQLGQAGGPAGAPPPGPPPAGGPRGAKQEGQDLLSLLDDLDDQSTGDDTTLDALLGSSSTSTSTDGTSTDATDLGSLLDAADSSSDSASSDLFGSAGTSSTDDLLSQLYSQLFKNFPNGSGLDTVA